MTLLVQKYGGTSVADIARIRAVAARVAACRARGVQVVVVVSAMAGETNRLLRLCAEIGAEGLREQDSVIATGEQIVAGLLALELQRLGVAARSLTGEQVGIRTDAAYGKARIVDIRSEVLRSALNNDEVPVVPGFQGRTATGDIATLGRGGTDTTAVALSAALSAKECQIFTDVDGIYTTDPRVCADARRLETVHVEEMLEMASLGAKVLQLRSVEFACKYQVPLRVLSSLTEDHDCTGGTLITYEENEMEDPVVTGVAFNKEEAKITVAGVPDKPGIAHLLLSAVAKSNINVDMIVQNVSSAGRTDFSFTVQRDEFARAMVTTKTAAATIGATEVLGDADIAKVSVVGIGMRSHPGVASLMFKTLSDHKINIQMISTSEIKTSVVIAEAQMETAVQALHAAFDLAQTPQEERIAGGAEQ